MKLATIRAEDRDGRLVVLSSDNARWSSAPEQWPTFQSAMDQWADAAPALHSMAEFKGFIVLMQVNGGPSMSSSISGLNRSP